MGRDETKLLHDLWASFDRDGGKGVADRWGGGGAHGGGDQGREAKRSSAQAASSSSSGEHTLSQGVARSSSMSLAADQQ